MRYTGKKGWQASYKDTWSLDYCLSPIILAGLKKFREVITADKHNKGIPASYITWDGDGREEEHDKAFDMFVSDIDKMIYAFDPNSKPDMNDYSFSFVEGPHHGEKEGACRLYDMFPSNAVEYSKLLEDEGEHERAVQEGLALFSKLYHNLWW